MICNVYFSDRTVYDVVDFDNRGVLRTHCHHPGILICVFLCASEELSESRSVSTPKLTMKAIKTQFERLICFFQAQQIIRQYIISEHFANF